MKTQAVSKRLEREKNYLKNRQAAYQKVFTGAGDVKEVLEDLKRFCRESKSCFHEDPRIHAMLEGRREVWLRIYDHLELSFEHLWAKYAEGDA